MNNRKITNCEFMDRSSLFDDNYHLAAVGKVVELEDGKDMPEDVDVMIKNIICIREKCSYPLLLVNKRDDINYIVDDNKILTVKDKDIYSLEDLSIIYKNPKLFKFIIKLLK